MPRVPPRAAAVPSWKARLLHSEDASTYTENGKNNYLVLVFFIIETLLLESGGYGKSTWLQTKHHHILKFLKYTSFIIVTLVNSKLAFKQSYDPMYFRDRFLLVSQ